MRLLIIFLPIMFYIDLGTTINISLADFLLPVILFNQITIQEKSRFSYEKQLILYILFILFAIVLSLLAATIDNHLYRVTYGMSNIIKIFVNSLYAIAIISYLKDEEGENELIFLRTWVYVATIFALVGIVGVLLYYSGIETFLTLSYRLNGSLNDPNLAAGYLIISLIFNQIYNSKYLDKSFSIISFILFIALLLTVSRGGILSLLIAIFISLICYSPKLGFTTLLKFLSIMTVIGVVILFIYLLADNTLLERVIQRLWGIFEDESTYHRLLLWKIALELWVEYPIVGVGSGQFTSAATELLNYKISNIPHNSYLGFLSETGLIGFISFIWLPIILLIKLHNRVTAENYIAFYLIVGLISISIQALTINVENIRALWIYFAFIYYWVNLEVIE